MHQRQPHNLLFFSIFLSLVSNFVHYNPYENRFNILQNNFQNNLAFDHLSIFCKPWKYFEEH